MCCCFVFVNSSADEGEWKVIVIDNRDEMYDRETIEAQWDNNLLYGKDEVGGGTWIGMDNHGRIGVLLNIKGIPHNHNALTRGLFVIDWLKSNQNAVEFAETLAENGNPYNGYAVVLIDRFEKDVIDSNIAYFSNGSKEKKPEKLEPGVYGFSNSVRQKPYLKVQHGLQKFQKALIRNMEATPENREKLINDCLEILQDKTKHYPDRELIAQRLEPNDPTDEILEAKSSVFVQYPVPHRYGTRSHTIILIDGQNHATYYESSVCDIPEDISQIKWKTKRYDFDLI